MLNFLPSFLPKVTNRVMVRERHRFMSYRHTPCEIADASESEYNNEAEDESDLDYDQCNLC
jgi:hypothetical protein